MPDFIRKQQEGNFDVVTGSRYINGGGVFGWNLRRKLTSRVANFIADTLLNPGVSDLTGSFRLYKKDAFISIMKAMQSKGMFSSLFLLSCIMSQAMFSKWK